LLVLLVLLVLLAVPVRDGGRPQGRAVPALRVARRSSMETATRKEADGVAATIRPQVVGWAWARLAARLSRIPPASTSVGQDTRRVSPCRLSRCRSRAAMTQVRSMQTATAQA
jgi:hypothetical protein